MTIPAAIRDRSGLKPNTEVAVESDGSAVRIVPVAAIRRGTRLVAHPRIRVAGATSR